MDIQPLSVHAHRESLWRKTLKIQKIYPLPIIEKVHFNFPKVFSGGIFGKIVSRFKGLSHEMDLDVDYMYGLF